MNYKRLEAYLVCLIIMNGMLIIPIIGCLLLYQEVHNYIFIIWVLAYTVVNIIFLINFSERFLDRY